MVSIVVGLVMLALGLWGLSAWWWSVTEVLRGVVPILLIILGPIALGAGVTQLRERNARAEPQQKVVEDFVN
ncbi:MAG: hypothetical protein HQL93_07875 [Magnetococcales bacterium]|nr:hypothetical protein [Magnetococcales bacterium]